MLVNWSGTGVGLTERREEWSWSLSLRLVYPVLHKPPGATITSRSAVRIRINFWRMVGLYISFGDWANALECWRSSSLRLVIPSIAVSPGVTHSDSLCQRYCRKTPTTNQGRGWVCRWPTMHEAFIMPSRGVAIFSHPSNEYQKKNLSVQKFNLMCEKCTMSLWWLITHSQSRWWKSISSPPERSRTDTPTQISVLFIF